MVLASAEHVGVCAERGAKAPSFPVTRNTALDFVYYSVLYYIIILDVFTSPLSPSSWFAKPTPLPMLFAISWKDIAWLLLLTPIVKTVYERKISDSQLFVKDIKTTLSSSRINEIITSCNSPRQITRAKAIETTWHLIIHNTKMLSLYYSTYLPGCNGN